MTADAMTAVLGRLAGMVRWLVGVGAATAVVLLVTLDGEADAPAPTASAEALYAEHCASCHGIDGGGGRGPRLAGAMATLYPDPADQEAVVRTGSTGMPGFDDVLDPGEIAAVVRYTRSGFG